MSLLFQGPKTIITKSVPGGADYTAKRYKAISLSGVAVISAGIQAGVLLNKPKDGGQPAEIGIFGIFPILTDVDAATRNIAIGDPITPAATTGAWKKAVTTGDYIAGVALEADAVGGKLIMAFIQVQAHEVLTSP